MGKKKICRRTGDGGPTGPDLSTKLAYKGAGVVEDAKKKLPSWIKEDTTNFAQWDPCLGPWMLRVIGPKGHPKKIYALRDPL